MKIILGLLIVCAALVSSAKHEITVRESIPGCSMSSFDFAERHARYIALISCDSNIQLTSDWERSCQETSEGQEAEVSAKFHCLDKNSKRGVEWCEWPYCPIYKFM